ncbi:hypothetical protein J2X20_005158 [Pelomonas saccharophila]|uniref:Uncharacterized protein n=1 Tax=Roseateles saccharophilus TaxID=304 RepID=A0ABU1YUF3_ROSSA|nr:hypothetical protein [Roseateles saccharophilus]MDR7272475.1 hypothetical protein [Roseateles saccharophilus]
MSSSFASPNAFIALCLCAAGSALAQTPGASPSETSALRRNEALLTLEYQTVKVPGDRAIDLLGFHAYQKVMDGVYLGGGFHAPLLQGAYGGFVAADLGVHLRRPLAGPLFAMAGLSAGGGGGGRSVEHSKLLSGSGGFAKAYAGLGYDFGGFSLAANVSRLKFRQAIIDGTQASLMLEMPFSYLTGPFSGHGQPLAPADDRRAGAEMGENMLTLSLDNYRQRSPQGSNKGTIGVADLQYAHFFGTDSYWFASLAMGYHGLPLYNQLLGGLGQRWRLTRDLTLYAQLGLGSGGYSSEVIDTASGLLVYPKLSAEYSLTRDLGLALSVGTMTAPKGSSRNQTWGLSLTRHLRSGGSGEATGPAHYEGLRLSVLHQTDLHLSYRGTDRPALQMLGLQLDIPVGQRWYLPLQASAAYNAYLGYPGYAEILGGLGVQTLATPGERLQAFAQLMAGANVHGKSAKASAGVRWLLDERLALNFSVGRIEARSAGGGQFKADNLAVGLDYRFSTPTR